MIFLSWWNHPYVPATPTWKSFIKNIASEEFFNSELCDESEGGTAIKNKSKDFEKNFCRCRSAFPQIRLHFLGAELSNIT